MNIRRFTSSNTRQAMALVRAEFGSQAIILRTRSVEGGVEIVAMADESLAGPPTPRAGSRPGRAPSWTSASSARPCPGGAPSWGTGRWA